MNINHNEPPPKEENEGDSEYSLERIIDYGLEILYSRLEEWEQSWKEGNERYLKNIGNKSPNQGAHLPGWLRMGPALIPLADAVSAAVVYAAAGDDVAQVFERLVAEYADWLQASESSWWSQVVQLCQQQWLDHSRPPLQGEGGEGAHLATVSEVWGCWERTVEAVRAQAVGLPWLNEAALLRLTTEVLPDALTKAASMGSEGVQEEGQDRDGNSHHSRRPSSSHGGSDGGSTQQDRRLRRMERTVTKLRTENAMLNEALLAANEEIRAGSFSLRAKLRGMETELEKLKNRNHQLLRDMQKAEERADRALQSHADTDEHLNNLLKKNLKLERKLRRIRKEERDFMKQRPRRTPALASGSGTRGTGDSVARQDKGEITEETGSSGTDPPPGSPPTAAKETGGSRLLEKEANNLIQTGEFWSWLHPDHPTDGSYLKPSSEHEHQDSDMEEAGSMSEPLSEDDDTEPEQFSTPQDQKPWQGKLSESGIKDLIDKFEGGFSPTETPKPKTDLRQSGQETTSPKDAAKIEQAVDGARVGMARQKAKDVLRFAQELEWASQFGSRAPIGKRNKDEADPEKRLNKLINHTKHPEISSAIVTHQAAITVDRPQQSTAPFSDQQVLHTLTADLQAQQAQNRQLKKTIRKQLQTVGALETQIDQLQEAAARKVQSVLDVLASKDKDKKTAGNVTIISCGLILLSLGVSFFSSKVLCED